MGSKTVTFGSVEERDAFNEAIKSLLLQGVDESESKAYQALFMLGKETLGLKGPEELTFNVHSESMQIAFDAVNDTMKRMKQYGSAEEAVYAMILDPDGNVDFQGDSYKPQVIAACEAVIKNPKAPQDFINGCTALLKDIESSPETKLVMSSKESRNAFCKLTMILMKASVEKEA